MPYVPAIVVGRALPDFVQNPIALRRSQNSSSLISARRKEDNWIVTKRRHMCQMAKWGRSRWRRPALRPHSWHPAARGRGGSNVALLSHNEAFGALILTPSRSSCIRGSRANSTAPGVSPWTQIVSPRTATSEPSTERTLPSRNIRRTR